MLLGILVSFGFLVGFGFLATSFGAVLLTYSFTS